MLQAGLDLVALLADDPHDVPARGGARALRPHRRAALRRVPRRRRAAAARRLRGRRRAGHGPPGRRVDDARVGAGRGRPGRRRRHLRARGRPQPHAPRAAGACSGAAAARSPGRRWCCAASSSAPWSSATPATATSRATPTRSRAWRAICAEAVAIQRTMDELAHRDKTVRELVDLSHEVAQTHDFERFVLRFAQRLLDRRQRRLRRRLARQRRRHPLGRQLHPGGRGPEPRRTRSWTPPATPRSSGRCSTTRRWRSATCATPGSAPDEVELMRGWGFASSLTMPLVAGGELVGLVDLYDDAERDWSADLESLTSVCQLVAGVFDSTALLDEARETARLREELVELGADLAAAEARGGRRRARRAPPARRHRLRGLRHLVARGGLPALPRQRGRATASTRPCAAASCELEHYPSTRQALEDRRDPRHQLAGRRAPHRLRARGLRRVRLPQHGLGAAREQRPGGRPDRPLRRARARLQRGARLPAGGRRAPWPTRCATPSCSQGCGAATPRCASWWSSATASTRRARSRSSPGRSPSACAPSWPPRTATSGRWTAACSAAWRASTATAGTPTRSGRSASSPPTRPPWPPWPPTSRSSSATSRPPT